MNLLHVNRNTPVSEELLIDMSVFGRQLEKKTPSITGFIVFTGLRCYELGIEDVYGCKSII